MGFIKNKTHFINYINKVIKSAPEGECDPEDLLPEAFYVHHIYDKGFADAFTWLIRTEGICVLEEDHVLKFLRDQDSQLRRDVSTYKFTEEFLNVCMDLQGVPGVYAFQREDGTILYVGRSVDVGRRMTSSFNRFVSYDRPVYSKYIVTQTASDAVLLEAFFISTLLPPMNRSDKYIGGLTLTLQPIPDWSEPMLCNFPKMHSS